LLLFLKIATPISHPGPALAILPMYFVKLLWYIKMSHQKTILNHCIVPQYNSFQNVDRSIDEKNLKKNE
jgi:hypothetical protein